jgi:hypothetical protein
VEGGCKLRNLEIEGKPLSTSYLLRSKKGGGYEEERQDKSFEGSP